MNEIVKYHNQMNEVSFGKFSKIELDLFFVICSKIKAHRSGEAVFSFDELKELSKYKQTSTSAFVRDIDRTYTKYLNLNMCKEEENGDFTRFVLFTMFAISPSQKNIKIKVNEDFKYILYELTESFTRFELDEFTDLKSSYSKTLYRLLKQYRSTGRYYISVGDFNRLFSVPKSYTAKRVGEKILVPAMTELSQNNCFIDLKIDKKTDKKRGNPIKAYEFTFKAENSLKKANKGYNINEERQKNLEKLKLTEQLFKDKIIG